MSRQVVVQDIALLRADGHDIVADQPRLRAAGSRGSPAVPTRLVKVRHSVEQAGDELTNIVDAGGAVLDADRQSPRVRVNQAPTWTSRSSRC